MTNMQEGQCDYDNQTISLATQSTHLEGITGDVVVDSLIEEDGPLIIEIISEDADTGYLKEILVKILEEISHMLLPSQ